MTEFEICRDYRLAKDPKEQINILSDMTGKTRAEIKEILWRNSQTDSRIKITPPREEKYGRTWTEEMDRMLLLLVGRGFTRKKIAEFMAMTKPRVENRLQKLKKEGKSHVSGLQIF